MCGEGGGGGKIVGVFHVPCSVNYIELYVARQPPERPRQMSASSLGIGNSYKKKRTTTQTGFSLGGFLGQSAICT